MVPNLTLDNMIRAVVEKKQQPHLLEDLTLRCDTARDQKKLDDAKQSFTSPSKQSKRVLLPPPPPVSQLPPRPALAHYTPATPPLPVHIAPRVASKSKPSSEPLDLTVAEDTDNKLTQLAIGRGVSAASKCVHCKVTIDAQSLSLSFMEGSRPRSLHFDCIKSYNTERKFKAEPPIALLSITGREVLSDLEKDQLKKSIRSTL